MAQAWMTDGSYIRKIGDWDDKTFVSNFSIESFLDTERDAKYFVIATKGFGKTFLIRYKRILYQRMYKDWNFIPEDSLVDKSTPSIDFKNKKNLFKKEETWRDIWLLSILLSTLKNMRKYPNPSNSEEISEIDSLSIVSRLLQGHEEIPVDYLATIINKYHEDLSPLKEELNNLLAVIRGRKISTTIIFIDGVDEIFKPPEKYKYKYSKTGVRSNDIWYFSQIGLMKAVRTLSDINIHIKIFSSIRKEAYLKMKESDEMSLQLKGNVLDLKYSKKELEDMFIKNIKVTDSHSLFDPELLDSDPIHSFLGLKTITHSRTGETEDIFDYIHRHTLKRPRDIMSMGYELSQLSDKNEENIARAIEDVARYIASQYITEVRPHIDFSKDEFDKLFDLINTRIIYKKDLKKICSKFNSQVSCEAKRCSDCEKIHVFGNLYKIGLLGVIEKDNIIDKYLQKFVQLGEMTFDNPKCVLPQSEFYFIHPILTTYISKNESTESQLDKIMIIGDGNSCDLKVMQDYFEIHKKPENNIHTLLIPVLKSVL